MGAEWNAHSAAHHINDKVPYGWMKLFAKSLTSKKLSPVQLCIGHFLTNYLLALPTIKLMDKYIKYDNVKILLPDNEEAPIGIVLDNDNL